MSKGSNSTNVQSSNAPNPVAYSSYVDVLNRASAAASKPYQAYGGEEVAGLNPTQIAGVGNISDLSTGFQPYASQAGSDISNAGAPITEADLSNYENPYTNQVVDATQADFNEQNARANSIVTGNAAAQGALGGNRVGVAQALTQQANTRAQAPVIAGLRSSGFQQAENAAQADKSRRLQAGSAELAGGEQTAQAQVGAGTLGQRTQQAQDTQARADYFQAQGYDFATAQYLAGIVDATGSQMGSTGTSNTQGPQPNQWLQAAGLGLAAGAMFIPGGAAAAPGIAAAALRRDGGRIRGFASGGVPGVDVTGGWGWVPNTQVQGHPLAPPSTQPVKMSDQSTSTAIMGMGKALGTIGKGLYDKYDDYADPGTKDNPLPTLDASDYEEWRGGRVPRRGFEAGGAPDDLSPQDAIDDRFSNPLLGSDQYRNIGEHSAALKAEGERRMAGVGPAVAEDEPTPLSHPVQTASFTKPGSDDIVRGGVGADHMIKQGVPVKQALARASALAAPDEDNTPEPFRGRSFAPTDDGAPPDASTDISAVRRAPAPRAPLGVAAATSGMGGWNPLGLSDEARQGLISMGLGMMSNRVGGKGSFLAGVGEGGQQGMQTYATAKAATAARDAQLRKEKFERERFDRPYNEMTAAQKAEAGLKPYRIGKDGKLEANPGGPADPATVRALAEAKVPPSSTTPQSMAASAQMYRMTGKMPQNIGKGFVGQQEAAQIRNLAAEQEFEAGGDPADWANRWQQFGTRATGLRTLENRSANLTLAETEARGLVPRVRELINTVDRTRFPDVNKLIQAGETKTGNENEIKLGIAMKSLVGVYARVIKPVGQIGVEDSKNAADLLQQYWSKGQMGAALDQFEVELQTAKEALKLARDEYGASGPSLSPKPKSTAPAATATPAPAAPAAGAPRPEQVIRDYNGRKVLYEKQTDGTMKAIKYVD